MARLDTFSVDDLVAFSGDLRVAGAGRTSMVGAAEVVTRYLYENLLDDAGQPACSLVRIFKTHPYRDLPAERQQAARIVDPNVTDDPETLCMTLLATNGTSEIDPYWLPEERALPFTSSAFAAIPVLPQIVTEIGLDIDAALDPNQALRLRARTARNRYNYYLDQDLANSPLLPDPRLRARIAEMGMTSLVVVGGILPTGHLLLVMWYACGEVPKVVADLFASLAVAIEAALVPFAFDKVFAPASV